jgi:diguanylate cyclase (GGDEF)-like protein/PAS domain S-box-containing protein
MPADRHRPSDAEGPFPVEPGVLRELMEHIREAFWISNPEKSEILYVSPGYEEVWGRDRESLYREPTSFLEAIHPDDRDRVLEALEGQTEGDYEEVYRVVRPDGSTRWVRDRAFPVRDGDGEVVRVVGIAEDITEQRRREEEIGRAADRFLRLFHFSPVPTVIATRREGRLVEGNDAAVELYGWDTEEVRGRPLEELDVWVEPDRETFLETLREEGCVERFEARHRRADGRVFDALVWSEPLEFDGRDCLVAVVVDISDRRELERALRRRAFYDSLTGLPNRDLLEDRLKHAMELSRRHDRRMALLFLDLDGFKAVNDEHGHGVGDAMLRETARRLEEAVRDHDTVARWGGDEFMVLLEEVDELDAVAEAARRLVEGVERPVDVGGLRLDVGVSVGVAVGPEGRTMEELIRSADAAMYEAKRDPERSVRFAGDGGPA